MAHEILAVKLCELEDQLSRLISRIHISETASHPQLQREIQALRQEYTEGELALRLKLGHSKTETASVLDNFYGEVQQSIQKARAALQEQAVCCGDPEAAAEEKILLAEYALDFAFQSANRALLLAMEAIDTQFSGQEGDKTSL